VNERQFVGIDMAVPGSDRTAVVVAHSTLSAFNEFLRMIQDAARFFPVREVRMHPRTYRLLKKDQKKQLRFPHLYREHYPKRRTRSMKGK
jgi:hypothetical protein